MKHSNLPRVRDLRSFSLARTAEGTGSFKTSAASAADSSSIVPRRSGLQCSRTEIVRTPLSWSQVFSNSTWIVSRAQRVSCCATSTLPTSDGPPKPASSARQLGVLPGPPFFVQCFRFGGPIGTLATQGVVAASSTTYGRSRCQCRCPLRVIGRHYSGDAPCPLCGNTGTGTGGNKSPNRRTDPHHVAQDKKITALPE